MRWGDVLRPDPSRKAQRSASAGSKGTRVRRMARERNGPVAVEPKPGVRIKRGQTAVPPRPPGPPAIGSAGRGEQVSPGPSFTNGRFLQSKSASESKCFSRCSCSPLQRHIRMFQRFCSPGQCRRTDYGGLTSAPAASTPTSSPAPPMYRQPERSPPRRLPQARANDRVRELSTDSQAVDESVAPATPRSRQDQAVRDFVGGYRGDLSELTTRQVKGP